MRAPSAVHPLTNRLQLEARLAEKSALRYTPAGLAAQDVVLEHQSLQSEAGGERLVTLRLKAVAFGTLAERLARTDLGSGLRCEGFLASPRRGHGVVLHIQAFEPQ
ncbi:restart primosome assembly protein PriB [Tepidimonas ignava]|uniref:Replication restart protein PriB n=1 Tax=Tepidimonas ignava TaxID=114249 RepID=A0A4R3LPM3_9BURK|nr:restart primosome assembly protein PriB [Tepidimonas ignava]TSE23341.1 Primosomal replication protein N [Tepidimonas ignava]